MYFRWFVKPHWVSRSGFAYEDNKTYRHRDFMARVTAAYKDDRYISPNDGKIKTLVVQTVDDILSQPGNSTWKRTYIRNVSPLVYRLATWPVSHIDMRVSKPTTGEDWGWLVAKWIPVSVALMVLVSDRIRLTMAKALNLHRLRFTRATPNPGTVVTLLPWCISITATQRWLGIRLKKIPLERAHR
jgi:hypothetical protein